AQAKHRSDSAARSTPTRALARDTPKKKKIKISDRLQTYLTNLHLLLKYNYGYTPSSCFLGRIRVGLYLLVIFK
ncbi:MAG: hypothetical protein RML94_14970, partial [Bacteroidia bacterium]|nr:hypothetical protein [Bacteroidia bacterium]